MTISRLPIRGDSSRRRAGDGALSGRAPPRMIRHVELRLHACEPGFLPRLLAELRDELPGGVHREASAGLVESALAAGDSAREPTLAFARQTLPDAHPLAAASVSAWARAATAALLRVCSPVPPTRRGACTCCASATRPRSPARAAPR